MSSAESGQRIKHVGLVTQQRRLRHLRSLSARNIIAGLDSQEKEALMESYFTLHLTSTSQEFYMSEKVQDSLNPTWRSFDLQKSGVRVDASRTCFIVRVWGGKNKDYKLIIEWKVNLKGLCYLGERIHKDGLRYQPNTIIFGMFEGFYSSSDNIPDTGESGDDDFKKSIDVEQNSAILCYSIYSLGRLHTTQRAICQTKASESKVRCAITERLRLAERKTKLNSDKETLILEISLLSEELKQRQRLLAEETDRCEQERVKVTETAEELGQMMSRLKDEWEQLKENKQLLHEKREQCRKRHHQFGLRKTTLISELSDIYPIVELGKNHAILGIKLPNAENYSGSDDTSTATALGHTCHLILMIARFLQLPLRYPMIHCGSRSVVRDHITEQLQARDRDFPLYSRGKERFQFNYAVYLLNRNIAQLRFALGLPTNDLRMTLPNLKSLLETKWGVKISSPSVLQVQPAQPQLLRGQTPEGALPRDLPPYPVSQYADTASESAAQVAIVAPEHIPNSPPPPYQTSDDQSEDVGDDNIDGVATDVSATDVDVRPVGEGADDGNNDNSTSIAQRDTSVSEHLVNKALQQTLHYEDNTPLSSSPPLDSHGYAQDHHGSGVVASEAPHDRESQNVLASRTIPLSHPVTAGNMPSINDAVNAIKETHSNNAIGNNTAADITRTDSLQQHVTIERPQCQQSTVDNPLQVSSVVGNAGSHNENHHNHNSHIDKLNSAVPKDTSAATTTALHVSNGNADTSQNHQENERLLGRDSDYTPRDDPLEVQRMMESLGTIDGMFQFEDLGSRTDALEEDASFSSFRKPSTSDGS